MGRVEEAIRRAKEQAGRERQVDGHDIDALAEEPFPVELAERRLRSAPAPAPPAAGVAVQHGIDKILERADSAPEPARERSPGRGIERVEPAPQPPEEAKPSLFERINAGLAEKVVIDRNMVSVSREQYRRLAAALYRAQEVSTLKVVMVGSAVAGEGKTLTTANLALTLSESYQRTVLLIDADLRRPSLHSVFQVDATTTGLSEGLRSLEERPMPLHQISEYLTLLPAGKPTADPMAGLTSARMRKLIAEARGTFEWVLIDTPPVGILSDANLLTSMADGTILVVKAGSTPYPLVQRAIHAIGKEHVLGIVLNRVNSTRRSEYGYYNNYYYGAR